MTLAAEHHFMSPSLHKQDANSYVTWGTLHAPAAAHTHADDVVCVSGSSTTPSYNLPNTHTHARMHTRLQQNSTLTRCRHSEVLLVECGWDGVVGGIEVEEVGKPRCRFLAGVNRAIALLHGCHCNDTLTSGRQHLVESCLLIACTHSEQIQHSTAQHTPWHETAESGYKVLWGCVNCCKHHHPRTHTHCPPQTACLLPPTHARPPCHHAIREKTSPAAAAMRMPAFNSAFITSHVTTPLPVYGDPGYPKLMFMASTPSICALVALSGLSFTPSMLVESSHRHASAMLEPGASPSLSKILRLMMGAPADGCGSASSTHQQRYTKAVQHMTTFSTSKVSRGRRACASCLGYQQTCSHTMLQSHYGHARE